MVLVASLKSHFCKGVNPEFSLKCIYRAHLQPLHNTVYYMLIILTTEMHLNQLESHRYSDFGNHYVCLLYCYRIEQPEDFP